MFAVMASGALRTEAAGWSQDRSEGDVSRRHADRKLSFSHVSYVRRLQHLSASIYFTFRLTFYFGGVVSRDQNLPEEQRHFGFGSAVVFPLTAARGPKSIFTSSLKIIFFPLFHK